MTYSKDSQIRKYVRGYGFMSLWFYSFMVLPKTLEVNIVKNI